MRRTLTANYTGDAGNTASSSMPMPLTVNAASTALVLVSATPDPSLVNTPVIVTAALSVVPPGLGVPDGTVAVSAADSAGCTIVLPATSCALTFTASGVKAIDAHYSGSQNFLGSPAVPLTHTVDDPPTIDLAIAIDDALGFVEGGQSTTYLITVQNNGSADSHGATVQDVLPANLSNAAWTCTPVGANASCAASGSGSIVDLADLPAGTAVIYQLTATVAESPELPVVQIATVSLAVGETDSNPANNTASDSDVVGLFENSFDPP